MSSAVRPVAIAYGGALEVARMDLRLHKRAFLSGYCLFCRDRFPCSDWLRAVAALGRPLSTAARIWPLGIAAATGLLLTATAAVGLLRW